MSIITLSLCDLMCVMHWSSSWDLQSELGWQSKVAWRRTYLQCEFPRVRFRPAEPWTSDKPVVKCLLYLVPSTTWYLGVPEFPLYSLLLEFCTTGRIVLGDLVLYGFALSISQRFPQDIGRFECNHRWQSQRHLAVNWVIPGGLGPFIIGH